MPGGDPNNICPLCSLKMVEDPEYSFGMGYMALMQGFPCPMMSVKEVVERWVFCMYYNGNSLSMRSKSSHLATYLLYNHIVELPGPSHSVIEHHLEHHIENQIQEEPHLTSIERE